MFRSALHSCRRLLCTSTDKKASPAVSGEMLQEISTKFTLERARFENAMRSLRTQYRTDAAKYAEEAAVRRKDRIQKIISLRASEQQGSMAFLERQKARDRLLHEMRQEEERRLRPLMDKQKEETRAAWAAAAQKRMDDRVQSLVEDSKSWITRENLDEAIERALASEVTYNRTFDYSRRGSKPARTTPAAASVPSA